MEKKYNVFIQWHENTSNYKRFDGGLRMYKRKYKTIESANRALADYLFAGDNKYFWYPWEGEEKGLQLGTDDTNVVIEFNSTEPASVDFGDGTIYVAEVVE
jgi:hypothetical protein